MTLYISAPVSSGGWLRGTMNKLEGRLPSAAVTLVQEVSLQGFCGWILLLQAAPIAQVRSYTDKAAELEKDLLSALAPWDWVEKEDFLPEYTGAGFFSVPQEQRIWGGWREAVALQWFLPPNSPVLGKSHMKNPQEFECLSWGHD